MPNRVVQSRTGTLSNKESSSELNSQSKAHIIALADVIAEIQNSRNGEPQTTVLKLSDLRKEYCKRLPNKVWRRRVSRYILRV